MTPDDNMYDAFNNFWTWFVVIGFVIFGIVEGAAFALGRSKDYTLSAWVWRHIGTRKGWTKKTTPLRIAVLVFLLWLAEHFTFGWF